MTNKKKNEEAKALAHTTFSVGMRKHSGSRWMTEVFRHDWTKDFALLSTTIVVASKPASWTYAFEFYQREALGYVAKANKDK